MNTLFPAQNAIVLAFHLFSYNYLEHVLYRIFVKFQSCSVPARSVYFQKGHLGKNLS